MKQNLSSTTYTDPISHDGVHDALTFLPAPAYFYEYLYREIAIIERTPQDMTLMKFLVEPVIPSSPIENYEVSIINFAKAINRSIRKSDFAARIGRYEFVLALSTGEKDAHEIANRITEIWRDEDFRFSYSSTPYLTGDGALSLLGRLDRSEVHRP
jgi:GGDEF domain-containing protein